MRRATGADAKTHAGVNSALTSLAGVPGTQWQALAARAVEPNGYYLPDWELAVNALSSGRQNADALGAWRNQSRLIGLLPVISMWRAYKIPLPALVSADPYGTLCTPLLDRDLAEEAVTSLLRTARRAGAHALILRATSLEGAAMQAITSVLNRAGLQPMVLQRHARAMLDATDDGDGVLREALGTKKLKELRRQRNRLAEHGVVSFDVARSALDVAAALETFLLLEASGWKGQRGTALSQNEGDAAFIRRAAPALAASGQCEIVTLRAGETPIAAAIVLRHQDRAYYFKLGVDERFAKFSPGVQLTLELTRHLCADPDISTVDSTAAPGHPMIDPIWRRRLAIGDVLVPLRPRDPVVTLIRGTLGLRNGVRKTARRLVRFIRARQHKPR